MAAQPCSTTTCRTCGEVWTNPQMYPIFQENAEPHELFASNKYLSDFLFNTLKIEMYDTMPKNVCSDCNNIIKTVIKFYNQCENAQELLEKTFKFKVALTAQPIEFAGVPKVEPTLSEGDDTGKNLIEEEDLGEDNLVKEEEIDMHIDDDDDDDDAEDDDYNVEDDSESSESEQENDTEVASKETSSPVMYKPGYAQTTILVAKLTVCPKCKHTADSTSELIKHITTKHASTTCIICKSTFVNIGSCNKHYREIHARVSKYKCDTCELVFTRKLYMREHFYTVHGYRFDCKFCDEKFNERGKFTYHVNTHKSHMCKICGKLFAQPCSLLTHERSHEGKPFACKVCGKSFVYQSFLNVHFLKHSNEKRHKCNICNKGFNYKKTYKLHMKTHESNRPRPFVCEQCGRNFCTSSALEVHMRVHMVVKPFKCDLCDRTFTTKYNMTTHRSSIHAEVESPISYEMLSEMMASPDEDTAKSSKLPYACAVCKKRFQLTKTLVKHFKIHSKTEVFPCDQCPKKYSCSNSLKQHKRCHTGDRLFSCNFCDKVFLVKRLLDKHLVTHTGISEGDCKCKECPAEFPTYQALSAHKQLHHNPPKIKKSVDSN